MIGDKVYIPGSPAITLPDLLQEAEVSIHLEGEDQRSPYTPVKRPSRPPSAQFETPIRRNGSFLDPNDVPSLRKIPLDLPPGPRDWSRDDWKLMDGCYTDERFALADRLGLGPEEMAPSDDVDLENVVDRYIEVIGGQRVAEVLGDSWRRFVFLYIPYGDTSDPSFCLGRTCLSVLEHCRGSNVQETGHLQLPLARHQSRPTIPFQAHITDSCRRCPPMPHLHET